VSAFRAALVALSAVVVTTACAAGQNAATSTQRASQDGTRGHVGKIQLEGVSLPAPVGSSYGTGADVPLTISIINNGHSSDTLTNVSSSAFTGGWDIEATGTVQAAQRAQATASANPFASSSAPAPTSGPSQEIPAGTSLPLGLTELSAAGGASARTLVLKGLADKSSPLFPGSALKITFSFAKAGDVTLTVPVQITAKANQQTLPVSYSPPA
jgi:copper(I)-binding protein